MCCYLCVARADVELLAIFRLAKYVYRVSNLRMVASPAVEAPVEQSRVVYLTEN